jgi:lipopolysaccharide assembly outer membrane protein LptD (OstA)
MKSMAIACFLLLLSGLLPAQAEHENPVVYADHKVIGEDAMRAAGHVEVLWQDYVIFADAIDFNAKTRELFAEGRVTMTTQDMTLSGEKLVFNLKTQQGELVDTFGLVSPVIRYQTDRLRQVDRETLTFTALDISSCAQILPRWSIRGRKGKIKKGKYIAMHDAVLRLKKLPVLYLPYLRYPLKKDGRATGFLFPGIGNSSMRGFFLQNAFFWAIRPNLDMTLGFDYFAKLGMGFSDELRYRFRSAAGTARFYLFRYREDNGVYNDTGSDWSIEADHRQTLPFLDSTLTLSVNRQSRPGFLRLLDNSFDRALITYFRTSFAWTAKLANMSLEASASRFETYYLEFNSSNVLEYRPSLSLHLNQQKLGRLPGYLSLAIDFQNVLRSGVAYEETPVFEKDVPSRRLTFLPSLRLPLLKAPWLSAALDLSSRNVFYGNSRDPETGDVLDEPLLVSSGEAELTLKGPTFYRLFEGGRTRLKHVIEPEFTVRYVAQKDQRDRLITVDYYDYPAYSYAGLSLTSRLLAKPQAGGSPREVLSYTISQNFYFDAAEANMYRRINGEYPKLSELSNRLRFQPVADMSFDATVAYNYFIDAFSNLNLSASYERAGAPLGGSLSFNVYRNPYAAKTYVFNRTVLGFEGRLDLPKFPVKLLGSVDYDFTAKEFRYGSIIARFDYQCLLFSAEFKVFSYLGRSETQFRFGVSLGNLGMVGDFFGK